MKRLLSKFPAINCFLFLFFLGCRVIAYICGYNFALRSYPISIVALAVISIVGTVLVFSLKIAFSKTQAVFSALLLPLSAINGLFYIRYSGWGATFVFALICCGCSIAILIRFAYPRALKITSAILSILLILCLLSFTYFDFIFQDFGKVETVKTVTSPENKYTAEVIAVDQGALGGATLVKVRSNSKSVDLLFCSISKQPVRVYSGRWGEFESMKISWKDENTLLINGREYYMNG